MSDNGVVKVLFVCLGNICRSPLGEGVLRKMAEKEGLLDFFEIDSAGTSGYNHGHKAYPLTRKIALSRGVDIEAHRARKITADDLEKWDYIIAMDSSNVHNIEKLGKPRGTLCLLRDFDSAGGGEIPDPYGCEEKVFEDVHDMIEYSCRNLLDSIIREYSLKSMGA
jgi:protein-tyrosine phosphatase